MPSQARFPYEYQRVPDSRDGDGDDIGVDLEVDEKSRTRWGRWKWRQMVLYAPVALVFFL
jgi:hypothetical protein